MLDAGGRTLRTAFGPHLDDSAALARARIEAIDSPIVEVWRDNRLIARLLREPPTEGAAE